jgi:hypothetical protein
MCQNSVSPLDYLIFRRVATDAIPEEKVRISTTPDFKYKYGKIAFPSCYYQYMTRIGKEIS